MSHSGTLLLFLSRAGVGGNGGECVSCICLAKVPSHATDSRNYMGAKKLPNQGIVLAWLQSYVPLAGCGAAVAGLFSCVGVMGCFLT